MEPTLQHKLILLNHYLEKYSHHHQTSVSLIRSMSETSTEITVKRPVHKVQKLSENELAQYTHQTMQDAGIVIRF